MTHVIEVSDATFAEQVVEASRERPVVVDFWAAWCQPCRVLGPMMERLAEEYGGRFVLAKVDVDANPSVATSFGISGIPAVKAFRDAGVVSEFVGVQPEATLRRFLDAVAPDDGALRAARDAEAAGELEEALARYRDALDAQPDNVDVAAGLARVLLRTGDEDAARKVVAPMPRTGAIARVAAELDLRDLAAMPGRIGAAVSRLLAGDGRSAMDEMLATLADPGEGEASRRAMVAAFDYLGEDDALTREFRPRLARALF